VIFLQKASEISTKTFDELAQQIMQLGKMLQTKDAEITRLEALCEKNKIDYKPKTTPPQQPQQTPQQAPKK